MQTHEDRVITEKSELDQKRVRLREFIGGDIYRMLDQTERSRLIRQLEAMTLYSRILGEDSQMSLPFEPQSITEQQDRYAAAVAEVIDREKMPDYRIGLDRKHVFDSPDGIRLIVSREIVNEVVFLHFSSSLDEKHDLFDRVRRGYTSKESCIRLMVARFRDISRDYRKAKFQGFSPLKEVPHWTIREQKLTYWWLWQ